jgi:hypothetical protein
MSKKSNSGGLRDENMKIVKGDEYHKATNVKETDVLKMLRAVGLRYSNLKIQPQRLIVQAPYDYYGKPLTEFTVSSKLLTQLPQNTQCALESLYISNFTGFYNTNHTSNFGGSVTATSGVLARGDTFTFSGISFDTTVPSLYDYFVINVLTTTGTYSNVMLYLNDVTNYATGSVVGTVIQPAYSTTGVQVSNQGFPTFPMGIQWAAQTLPIDFCSYNATATGFSGMTNINVELLGYSNPNIWDTGLGLPFNHNTATISQPTTNVGGYSNIIGTAPCNTNTLGESCSVGGTGKTQLNFFQAVNFNTPAYPIKDPNFLNNSQLQFRLTYNQGGKEYTLPQPQDNASIVPYNLAGNNMGSTTQTVIPYNTIYNGTTWTAPASGTVRAGFTFALPPVIRFTLVFYPMVGVDQIEDD